MNFKFGTSAHDYSCRTNHSYGGVCLGDVFIFGKTYDAVMLCAGGIGFSMGSTANGLANMQAIAEKYGSSPRAWLIISLVGAFLIDLINALLVTWMGAW